MMMFPTKTSYRHVIDDEQLAFYMLLSGFKLCFRRLVYIIL